MRSIYVYTYDMSKSRSVQQNFNKFSLSTDRLLFFKLESEINLENNQQQKFDEKNKNEKDAESSFTGEYVKRMKYFTPTLTNNKTLVQPITIGIFENESEKNAKYDFSIYENPEIDEDIEQTLSTIYNYRKIKLKEIKTKDYYGNKIYTELDIFVHMKYNKIPVTELSLNKKKCTIRSQSYKQDSLICTVNSEILSSLLDQYDLIFSDDQNNDFIIYKFYNFILIHGAYERNLLFELLNEKSSHLKFIKYLEKTKENLPKIIYDTLVCEYESEVLSKMFIIECRQFLYSKKFLFNELMSKMSKLHDHRSNLLKIIKQEYRKQINK